MVQSLKSHRQNPNKRLRLEEAETKNPLLVGGFNPLEKYKSQWKSSPNRDETTTQLDDFCTRFFPQIKTSIASVGAIGHKAICETTSLPA